MSRQDRPEGEFRSAQREGAPMTSIRRMLLAWLLLGLAAVAVLATLATYVETRREIGDLFDLQLKQLAYSTQIDDLLAGRAPHRPPRDGRRVSGVAEIVTQIWDRDGVLVYWSQPGAGWPVPVTEGYSDVVLDGRVWRVYTHVSGGHALQVAHALDERRDIAAQAALRTLVPLVLLIPLLGVPDLVCGGPRVAPARRSVPRRRDPPARCDVPAAGGELAAGAATAGGEPQRAARASGRGALRAAQIHRGCRARTAHAARGARVAGRFRRAGDGCAGTGRRHGRAQGRRRPRGATGRAAADHGATRTGRDGPKLFHGGSGHARQRRDRRPRAHRRSQRHRPGTHRRHGGPGARRLRKPRNAARQSARQCIVLHARRRSHRRRPWATSPAGLCWR